jgi:hypothetical protein
MSRNKLRRIFISLGLAVVALVMVMSVATASNVRELRMEDKCDAATFPPEAGCTSNGGVTQGTQSSRI